MLSYHSPRRPPNFLNFGYSWSVSSPSPSMCQLAFPPNFRTLPFLLSHVVLYEQCNFNQSVLCFSFIIKFLTQDFCSYCYHPLGLLPTSFLLFFFFLSIPSTFLAFAGFLATSWLGNPCYQKEEKERHRVISRGRDIAMVLNLHCTFTDVWFIPKEVLI